jgi:hypothetical protein
MAACLQALGEYRVLQGLAKACGIRANQSKDALIAQLTGQEAPQYRKDYTPQICQQHGEANNNYDSVQQDMSTGVKVCGAVAGLGAAAGLAAAFLATPGLPVFAAAVGVGGLIAYAAENINSDKQEPSPAYIHEPYVAPPAESHAPQYGNSYQQQPSPAYIYKPYVAPPAESHAPQYGNSYQQQLPQQHEKAGAQEAQLPTALPPKDARTSPALVQGDSTATFWNDGKDVSQKVVTSAQTPQAAPPIKGIKADQTSDSLEMQPTRAAVQPTKPQQLAPLQTAPPPKDARTSPAQGVKSLDTLASHAVR